MNSASSLALKLAKLQDGEKGKFNIIGTEFSNRYKKDYEQIEQIHARFL